MRVWPGVSAAPRRAVKIARNALRDLRYRGLLAGTVRTRYAHLGAHHTTNSDYDDLPALFDAAGLRADDVIVDVGCGKGRVVNWLLAHHPGNAVYGIELDPEIAAATGRRLRRYPSVRILCGDASTLLPAEATVFYLFNPFDEPVMRRFARSVLDLGDAPGGAERRIVYYRSNFLEPFRESDRFRVEPIELPTRVHEAALITVRAAAASSGAGPRRLGTTRSGS
jgi:SAM-dependent methyltransferase